MRSRFLVLAVVALTIGLVIPAGAEESLSGPAPGDAQSPAAISAADLLGKDVHDSQGEAIGEVASVMVTPEGSISAIVIDISRWLEDEKLVALGWSEVSYGTDGRIVTGLTRSEARQYPAFAHGGEEARGKVLDEAGRPYQEDLALTQAGTGNSPGAQDEVGAIEGANDGTSLTGEMTPTTMLNADGSLNATRLLGSHIENRQGEELGKIGEILLAEGGSIAGILVDVGGFLGIGAHTVLLKWSDVELAERGDTPVLRVEATAETLGALPAYGAEAR